MVHLVPHLPPTRVLDCGRKPENPMTIHTQTNGEHANSTQEGPRHKWGLLLRPGDPPAFAGRTTPAAALNIDELQQLPTVFHQHSIIVGDGSLCINNV